MKRKSNLLIFTTVGTMIGAGIGLMAFKKMNCKNKTIKKTAGKALHAVGSFIENMSF